MKSKHLITKVLTAILCIAMLLGVLSSCASEKDLKSLQALTEEVKQTADAAATAEALATAVAEIDAVKVTADAAATKEALTAAEDALKVLINTGDESNKAAIALLETAVAELKSGKADVSVLNEVKAELDGKIAELDAKIAAITDKLTTAETGVGQNKADIDALKASVAALTEKLDALTVKVNDNKTAISALKTALDAVSALEGDTQIVVEIKKLQDKLELAATAESLKAVSDQLKALKTLVGTQEGNEANSVWANLNKAISEIEAIKTDYATVEKMTEAVTAVKKELSKASETLETKLNGKLAELSTALETLTGKHNSDITSINNSIAALQVSLNALSDTVESLQSEDFSTAYNYASKVLMGIVDEINEEDRGFSLVDFDEFVASISEVDYDELTYKTFQIAAERERFYLNRALNVKDIKDSFARLQKLVNDLPTLLESLEARLEEIDGEAPTRYIDLTEGFENYITSIKTTYGKLTPDDKALIDERYNAVLAAYDNLVNAEAAAEAVINEIAVIPADMVYGSSETAVNAALESFNTYKTTYFADEAVTVLYAETMTAEKLVTNYETLKGYNETLVALKAAFDIKPETIELVENYATAKPLYTDLEALNAHKGEIDTWAEENGVNEANIVAMYGAEYIANLAAAIEYASTMNGFYTSYEIASLIETLNTLCADDYFIVYKDRTTVEGCRTTIDDLKAAVDGYATSKGVVGDGNFAAMIDAELLAKFTGEDPDNIDGVEDRMAQLVEAKLNFDALLTAMNAQDMSIDNTLWAEITAYETTINNYLTTYDIEVDDENYDEFVKAAVEKQAALVTEYKAKTAQIAEVYKTINALQDQGDLLIAGKNLYRINTEVYPKIILEYDVTNPDLTLTVDDVPVNLKNLLRDFSNMLADYKELAATAVSEAAALKTSITSTIADLSAKDIKNVGDINAVMADVNAWLAKYVEAETEDKTYSDRLADIADVNVIHGTGYYAFLSVDDYEDIVAHNNAVNTRKTEAEAAWAEVEAKLVALTTPLEAAEKVWTIHSDFAGADAAYVQYIEDYYASDIDTETECFGEATTYAAFLVDKNEYTTATGSASDDAAAIRDAINALVLADITTGNASTVAATVDAIFADIQAYQTNYGCKLLEDYCECGVTEAMVLLLKKAEARADYTVAYNEFVAKYATELAGAGTAGVSLATVATDLDNNNSILDMATIDSVENIKTYMISLLNNYAADIDEAIAA